MAGGNSSNQQYISVKQTVKVTKNGTQFIVRIPANIAGALELKEGDRLELQTQERPREFMARVVSDDAKKK